MGSQETFLSNYEGNSQDLRSRGPHKRRLASSRGKLAYIEEPPSRDLPSPPSSSSVSTSASTSTLPYTPSPVTPNSASSTVVVSPKRKISYMNAVSSAWDSTNTEQLQSVNEDVSLSTLQSDHTKFSFNYQNDPTRTGRKVSAGSYSTASQRTSRHSMNYSDLHHRRWSTITPAQQQQNGIEIVGPTSSSTEWLYRNNRRSEPNLIKGPESCL